MLNVSLGCGMKKPEGFVGIDIRAFDGVDHVMNIGEDRLPFEDSSVDFIESDNVFEHLYPEEFLHCMKEVWRVLKPMGKINIRVPKAGTPAYYIHPDHKIQFLEDTFGFFQVPAEGVDPHGYMDGCFFHVSVLVPPSPQMVWADLYPNKPEGRYPYKEVKLYGEK